MRAQALMQFHVVKCARSRPSAGARCSAQAPIEGADRARDTTMKHLRVMCMPLEYCIAVRSTDDFPQERQLGYFGIRRTTQAKKEP